MHQVILAAVTLSLGLSISTADAARDVTAPVGSIMRVRLESRVASNTAQVEDTVRGRLATPLIVNGRTVLPAGTVVIGSVTGVQRSGKVKGRGSVALRFHTVEAPNDERLRVSTRTWTRVAPGTKEKDAAKIALPAVGGAVIGAIAGDGKGAAIGAAIGGGAGTAAVLSTRGQEVRLGPGNVLVIRLTAPLTVND